MAQDFQDFVGDPALGELDENSEPISFSQLARGDTYFSQLLLDDFIAALYARAQNARNDANAMALLSPYISSNVRTQLLQRKGRSPDSVSSVVISSQHLKNLRNASGKTKFEVVFDANYTESTTESEAPSSPSYQGYYAEEVWKLERVDGVKSRSPEKMMTFDCPNCGAPLADSVVEKCTYCGEVFGTGQFHWFVTDIRLIKEGTKGPALTSDVVEAGTEEPTVVHWKYQDRLAQLSQRDPSFDWIAFLIRVDMIFHRVQKAWSARSLEDIRPFVTDRFYFAQSYWVEEYRKQKLQNILSGLTIEKVDGAKIVFDPFFDGFTVRIFATGYDVTVDETTQEIVCGSKEIPRPFTEYWTFIRSNQPPTANNTEKKCPTCAAPIQMAQHSLCTHCGSMLLSDQFDWVLSRIEQDDNYHS